jgi:capsular polysaccharide biosynthesis protein/Mrp family chromosome partitioning ATPase
MASQRQPVNRSAGLGRDEGIDSRRYVAALRRSVPMMLGIVVVLTVAVALISFALAKTYKAESQIIVTPSDASSLVSSDAASEQRDLATLQTLITSPSVLTDAGKVVHRTREDLQSRVTSTLDPNANIITITATDGTAQGAADVANAVAKAFLASRAATEKASLTRATAELQRQINEIAASPDANSASGQAQQRALRDRLAELAVQSTNAGTDLQLARAADPPAAADSPRPLRNTILAFFVAVFIAVIAALARDQLRPGVTDQRELADVLGLPVLATIPERPGRLGQRRAPMLARVEQESYRLLSASMRMELRPDHEHVVLTTSALHAEGKTSVTTRLGRQLAEAGRHVLIVSGDLRWPRMDSELGLAEHRGLSDLLAAAERGEVLDARAASEHIVRRANGGSDVMPAGTILGDRGARLLSGDRLVALFAAVTDLGYDFVLVDAPPLLGISDAQLLAAHCDEILVVTRLRGQSLDTMMDLRSTLERLPIKPIGVVAIGGQISGSPYYHERPEAEPSNGIGDTVLPEDFPGRALAG